jgi:hypothetical protein
MTNWLHKSGLGTAYPRASMSYWRSMPLHPKKKRAGGTPALFVCYDTVEVNSSGDRTNPGVSSQSFDYV